ncbi:MAG: hypothetical protein ACRDJX_00425 [Solirubrobacteraceae bacterium]
MNSTSNSDPAPLGAIETGPLVIGMLGIAVPVALVAVACVTGSVIVLILSVLSVLAVGAGTLVFIMRLAREPVEDDSEAHGEPS